MTTGIEIIINNNFERFCEAININSNTLIQYYYGYLCGIITTLSASYIIDRDTEHLLQNAIDAVMLAD